MGGNCFRRKMGLRARRILVAVRPRRPRRAIVRSVPFFLGALCSLVVHLPFVFAQDSSDFEQHIRPLLKNLCYDCHAEGTGEGGLEFDAYDSAEKLIADQKLWGKVWDNVLTETMPPAEMTQPTAAERKLLSRWIAQTVFQMDAAAPDPGRVTIRRLNREEYRWSVYDLLGVDFPVYDHFPTDDTGYGFDTIGDVLTVPPPLIEKYFSAAEQVLRPLMGPLPDHESALYQRVFFAGKPPAEADPQRDYAHEILKRFATRAFRRPVDDALLERLLRLVGLPLAEQPVSFEDSVSRVLIAILVSPRFLYRAEYQSDLEHPPHAHPLDDYALASRLSYFLWSSIPDQQLSELAAAGRLRNELGAQLERMLADPKSDRFAENFVGQWLRMRDVEGVHIAKPLSDIMGNLRPTMRRETELLFAHVMRKDRDVIELITADYTFLDARLAEYYGIPGVESKKMRLVKIPADYPRGGVLTHGSVLLVTSNPDRTSPVKRGQFILENILGTPAPPAPPDVPPLEEATRGVTWHLTMRERLALHREDPLCASCHDSMDPLGLGLENFDPIGLWRDTDDGMEIDPSGQLVSGEEFSGVMELREILSRKRRLFYRCLTRKMIIYALGRGIEYTDTLEIENIVDAMLEGEGRFSTMLLGIVESPQFLLRRGYDE